MPFAPFGSGKLRAALLNAAFGYVPAMVIKGADETIISNATYQDDNELQYPVSAGVTYGWRLSTMYTSGATPDIKFQLTGPAGLTWYRGTRLGYDTGGSFGYGVFTGGVIGAQFGGTDLPLDAWGSFVVGATAGTLKLQWAQNTLTASNTTVHTGSSLQVWKV